MPLSNILIHLFVFTLNFGQIILYSVLCTSLVHCATFGELTCQQIILNLFIIALHLSELWSVKKTQMAQYSARIHE